MRAASDCSIAAPQRRRSAGGTAMRRSRSRARSARRQALISGQSGMALEALEPGAQLDLPGPGAAPLVVDVEIGLGDRIGLEHAVRAARAGTHIATWPLDPPIDHEMRDMDVLRRQFARHALGEAS